VLLARGIAPLGMKSLGGDARQVTQRVITAEEGIRYAMSLPVSTVISGIDSLNVLRRNVRIATGFRPMTRRQMEALRRRVADHAADGRYELYKTTAMHEGEVGRRQHGFPSEEELSA
jgi:hypothetical protein